MLPSLGRVCNLSQPAWCNKHVMTWMKWCVTTQEAWCAHRRLYGEIKAPSTNAGNKEYWRHQLCGLTPIHSKKVVRRFSHKKKVCAGGFATLFSPNRGTYIMNNHTSPSGFKRHCQAVQAPTPQGTANHPSQPSLLHVL